MLVPLAGHQAFEHYTNPVALGARWLAYSESKVHIILSNLLPTVFAIQICSHHQSIGGVSDSLAPPMASTVVTTVKKGFAAISKLFIFGCA